VYISIADCEYSGWGIVERVNVDNELFGLVDPQYGEPGLFESQESDQEQEDSLAKAMLTIKLRMMKRVIMRSHILEWYS
jgi:hypothetical protein